MTHKTRGIVIRVVKYGETSIIATIYTESFGLQSYLINNVRQSKNGGGPGNTFQPCAILDLVVYHNELKNLQRIKEYKFAVLFDTIFTSVIRNISAQYIIELFGKSVKQTEHHPDMYYFLEDTLLHLDKADDYIAAGLPLYFNLHLSGLLGFRIIENYSETSNILDLKEGSFKKEIPGHPYYLDKKLSALTSELLKVQQPVELEQFNLHHETRRALLEAYHDFYRLHIHDFGKLNTIEVLKSMQL